MEAVSIDTFVGGLSNKVLHCRELGHSWHPLTVQWDPEAQAYDRQLRCPSCRTIRVQILNRLGQVLSNRYRYPEGYLAKGVPVGEASGRDRYRQEALERFLTKHSEGEVA